MAKRQPKNTPPRPSSESLAKDSATTKPLPISRTKLWSFRLLTLVFAPLVFVAVAELVLRLAGYGYATEFLLKREHAGQNVLVQNNEFGWRFFGRDLARWPYPFSISQAQERDTVRILLLGESAARGEPQPDFGVARVLQAMLSLKYPTARFEVVNTAMTAINSHVILPIARDCVRADADVWVIYMGNNEVVGPFGAGTVFGAQTPPRSLIRANLALKTTRTGQLLDAMQQRLQPSRSGESVWGGMTLFLDQQVRADDPRMKSVYHHFERNLEDILRMARRNGAGVVLSTVAVNLKDCSPFASTHRPDLTEAEQVRWREFFQLGITAQAAGNHQAAAAHFQAAAQLDDSFAELRFRQGECALALGHGEEAHQHFQAARDFDTLRFRCDTQINETIRRVADKHAQAGVQLAEAEQAFAAHSPAGLPGADLFYEHVHFTFAGNYLLARILAEQVVKLLPASIAGAERNDPWPSPADCARRLARSDWNEVAALNTILTTLNDPPFTGQLGHEERLRQMEAALARLAPALQPDGLAQAMQLTEAALESAPNDPVLHKQLARLKKVAGDFPGAAAAARRELELLPSDSEGWALLGSILAGQALIEEAAVAYRRAFQLGPQGLRSALELAGALATLGQHDEALDEYQRIVTAKPRFVRAWLEYGQVLESLGRKAEADACFRQALTNRSLRLPELTELGGFYQNRGASDLAVVAYQDAVKLNPTDARLQLFLARNLASLGRYEDADQPSAEAVRLAPDFVEARLMHGIVLWRRGRAADARDQFEEALRLRPESLDARLNLGLTLIPLGQNAEALALFEEVLRQSPTNAVALRYVRKLRNESAAPESTHHTPQNPIR